MLIEEPTKKRVCVVDTETPPFAYESVIPILPFTLGFFDGVAYFDFWGADCVAQFFAFLAEMYAGEELLIYAHNGGGFDFFFFMAYVDANKEPVIIRGRLTKMWFQGQEFRDSYKIIPTSLASYQKEEFDYAKNLPEVRENHKQEILKYQRSDCMYLFDLVDAYQKTFGDALTIGGTAIKVLSEFHPWDKISAGQDGRLRPYYFGGRNQCFETGIKRGRFKVYDVNSMYPHVMRSFQHPVGNKYDHHKRVREGKTCFIHFEGLNRGALPVRKDDGGLSFLATSGKFYTSIHEFNAGLETGTITVKRIIHTVECNRFTDFKEFIDTYYDLRLSAKELQDLIYDLFYKLLMNNSYGKFAQDPSTYKDYAFTFGDPPESGALATEDKPNGWRVNSTFDIGAWSVSVWERPAKATFHGYKNVGTAASITGGSRAEIMRGLASATRPVYCDTDSIICEGLGADLNEKRLGAWKLEAECEAIAIAGKKMYACLTSDYGYAKSKFKKSEPEKVILHGVDYWCVKSASKGVRLSANEIVAVARGGTIEYANPVPHFKIDGSQDYVSRKIKRTGTLDFMDTEAYDFEAD